MHRNHPVIDFTAVVDDETQLVDVRQPAEVSSGSLAGAINIPLDQLAARTSELDPDKRVVLVCRSGGRSVQAAEFLVGVGFVDVVNLDGGMFAYTEGAAS